MGAVKQWLLEEAEKERQQEVRNWLKNKLGREPTEIEIEEYRAEFELNEALAHVVDKDD